MEIKINKFLTLACAFTFVFALTAGSMVYNDYYDVAGIPGMVIGALVGVVFAVTLLPIIGNQSNELEADSTNFTSTERTIIGLWPLLIVLGVVFALVGWAM